MNSTQTQPEINSNSIRIQSELNTNSTQTQPKLDMNSARTEPKPDTNLNPHYAMGPLYHLHGTTLDTKEAAAAELFENAMISREFHLQQTFKHKSP